jgi:hypothetical protein
MPRLLLVILALAALVLLLLRPRQRPTPAVWIAEEDALPPYDPWLGRWVN